MGCFLLLRLLLLLLLLRSGRCTLSLSWLRDLSADRDSGAINGRARHAAASWPLRLCVCGRGVACSSLPEIVALPEVCLFHEVRNASENPRLRREKRGGLRQFALTSTKLRNSWTRASSAVVAESAATCASTGCCDCESIVSWRACHREEPVASASAAHASLYRSRTSVLIGCCDARQPLCTTFDSLSSRVANRHADSRSSSDHRATAFFSKAELLRAAGSWLNCCQSAWPIRS